MLPTTVTGVVLCSWVSALLAANTIAASGEADSRVSLDQQASAAEASDADESADGAAPLRPKDAALVTDKDKEPLVRVLSSIDGRSATARATLISDSTASLKAKLKEQNFDDQATPPAGPTPLSRGGRPSFASSHTRAHSTAAVQPGCSRATDSGSEDR